MGEPTREQAVRDLGRVSDAPTLPGAHTDGSGSATTSFDMADLYGTTAPTTGETRAAVGPALDEKLRQAYFWVTNHAIISPHYDLEFEAGRARPCGSATRRRR